MSLVSLWSFCAIVMLEGRTEGNQGDCEDASVADTSRNHGEPVDGLAGMLVIPSDHQDGSEQTTEAAEDQRIPVHARAAHVDADTERSRARHDCIRLCHSKNCQLLLRQEDVRRREDARSGADRHMK